MQIPVPAPLRDELRAVLISEQSRGLRQVRVWIQRVAAQSAVMLARSPGPRV